MSGRVTPDMSDPDAGPQPIERASRNASSRARATGKSSRPSPTRTWLPGCPNVLPGRRSTPSASTRSAAKRSASSGAARRGKPTDPAAGRTQVANDGSLREEGVEPGEVRADQGPGPGEHGLAGPQGDDPEDLGGRGGADRGVVLEGRAAGEQVPVARGEPADPEPGEGERLGQDADRDEGRREVRPGRQGRATVVLEEPVDLVGDEAHAGRRAGVSEGPPLRVGREHAGGIVGSVDHHDARVGPDRGDQARHVQRPSVGLAELVEGHVGTGRSRNLVEALVARPRDDRVIAGTHEHVQEAEDRFLGTAEDEDVVGVGCPVERRDLGPQERMAGRFGIAEPEIGPGGLHLVVGEGEQLGHRPALHVGRAEQVAGGELPAGEVALQGEVGQSHGRSLARAVADVRAGAGGPTRVTASSAAAGSLANDAPGSTTQILRPAGGAPEPGRRLPGAPIHRHRAPSTPDSGPRRLIGPSRAPSRGGVVR